MISYNPKIKQYFQRYLFFWLAVIAFITAGFFENIYLKNNPVEPLILTFEKKLQSKEQKLDALIYEISDTVKLHIEENNFFEVLHPFNKIVQNEDFCFFVFKNNSLVYWSDQAVDFKQNQVNSIQNNSLVELNNGFFIAKKFSIDEFEIIGLMLLKRNYPYENEYLQNKFNSDFNLPDSYEILELPTERSFPISDNNENYLFSIAPTGEILCTDFQLSIPAFFYILGLLLFLIYLRREFKISDWPLTVKFGILIALLFTIYWLHILFKIPKVFYQLDLSSPDHFSYNFWLPSLGGYFLLSLFFFFWAINFGLSFDIKQIARELQVKARNIVITLLVLCGLLFLFTDYYIKLLINNSSNSFLLNRITDLSVQSIIGYLSIGMFLMGIIIILVKLIDSSRLIIYKKYLIVIGLIVTILCFFIQILFGSGISLAILFLFLFYIFFFIYIADRFIHKLSLSYLVLLIFASSIYSLVTIFSTNSEREREIQKSYAIRLDAQHDPAAEIFLSEIYERLQNDETFYSFLISPYDELEDYLANTYFSGYFRKYDMQIYICEEGGDINIQPDNISLPCLPFFEEMIEKEGDQIPDTRFYYMNKTNRSITYMGWISIPLPYEGTTINIFIELNSTLASIGLGYPELLMDNTMKKPNRYENFTYAKYYQGELIDQYGEDYQYNYNISSYEFVPGEFSIGRWDGKEHIIYQPREDNYVIVSRDIIDLRDYLISFPYIFVFFFLLSTIVLLTGNKSFRSSSNSFDLKFKIQASIISIVFFSLLVVAVGSILYNINEYEIKYREDLEEKMKSISEEIGMELYFFNTIEDDIKDGLRWYLVDLSNIFRTDINIFGTDGDLIVSSREEIYSNGLISGKMNTEAYYEMFHNLKSYYIQPEQIGNLSYLSAYQPIINNMGKYIGFINLPYFTRQDKYSQEITTFIVAFINLYVILLLISIAIAVFISNQVSRPLTQIRENLRRIELGKRNEPIGYKGTDEIGILIKEYNKKVEELAESADLLARSERESAWREMAKQIAHEIKNPLTPMKLSIQHLQRTKNNDGQKDEYIEHITNTLIEQIDNLSAIATEFSNFAKIPIPQNNIFDLSKSLHEVVELYKSHDKARVILDIPSESEIKINADKEQLKRAMINLIRNGIQAIPHDRQGLISVSLTDNKTNALIKVEDNGIGIPPELQEKLFSPSFTTKSSGMGLGLSIVKNIIENFKGRVWFETEIDKGSTFFVELPVYNDKKII